MKKEKTNYDILREKILSKPGAQEYYDSLQPEREMIMAVMELRQKYGLTQQDLSNITGIDRADVSKIENGNANPTVKTLMKIAKALDTRLEIKFIPLKH